MSGGAKCWGHNHFGQVGNGATSDAYAPDDVVGLGSGVTAISGGDQHTCALTSGGGVKCWGLNSAGHLGNDSLVDSSVPVDVAGLGSGVVMVSAGGDHTCALTDAGGVKCWGGNASGQLGDGSGPIAKFVPVDVVGLVSGVIAISAGSDHTCAVTSAGRVKCWGAGLHGQLGDSQTIGSPIPIDVPGMSSGADSVSAGMYHTCARMMDKRIKCWGYNFYGQLGNNSTIDSPVPVDVSGL
jgi:alpha-tubulin suppressor-like RCC1 family protein